MQIGRISLAKGYGWRGKFGIKSVSQGVFSVPGKFRKKMSCLSEMNCCLVGNYFRKFFWKGRFPFFPLLLFLSFSAWDITRARTAFVPYGRTFWVHGSVKQFCCLSPSECTVREILDFSYLLVSSCNTVRISQCRWQAIWLKPKLSILCANYEILLLLVEVI